MDAYKNNIFRGGRQFYIEGTYIRGNLLRRVETQFAVTFSRQDLRITVVSCVSSDTYQWNLVRLEYKIQPTLNRSGFVIMRFVISTFVIPGFVILMLYSTVMVIHVYTGPWPARGDNKTDRFTPYSRWYSCISHGHHRCYNLFHCDHSTAQSCSPS